MIDKKTIESVAKLARLHITESEAVEYSAQLVKVLHNFEQISKIDTTGVDPMITPTEIESFWREDIAQKKFTTDEMLANAPASSGHLFKVPPVV